MSSKPYSLLIVAVFILIAVFGMPLMTVVPDHHGFGCPFSRGETALCAASILDHIRHWQSALAAILLEILVLSVIALYFSRPLSFKPREIHFSRWRIQQRTPLRPTLLQELFAGGILNRKEPHLFFAHY